MTTLKDAEPTLADQMEAAGHPEMAAVMRMVDRYSELVEEYAGRIADLTDALARDRVSIDGLVTGYGALGRRIDALERRSPL